MMRIRRTWTPRAADNWSREDWLAATLSVLAYLLLILGSALSLLARPLGYVLLLLAIVVMAMMYWVIDPKLRAVSSDYEKKQKEYLQQLETVTRWRKEE